MLSGAAVHKILDSYPALDCIFPTDKQTAWDETIQLLPNAPGCIIYYIMHALLLQTGGDSLQDTVITGIAQTD